MVADRLENGHERSNCEFSISWEHSWLFTRNLFDSQQLMNIYLTRCRAVRSIVVVFSPIFAHQSYVSLFYIRPFSFFPCNSSTFFSFFLSQTIGKNLELTNDYLLIMYRRRKWIKREMELFYSIDISWTIKFLLTEMSERSDYLSLIDR